MPAYRPRGLMESRREDVKRIDAMTVKVTRVTGRVLVVGSGEVTVNIPFAVNFTEKPVFNFGGELDDNHRATAGRYPTVSGVIVGWEVVKEIEGATDGYFVAADIALVTTGQDDQNMWFHYSFEGKAIRNPLLDIEGTDDSL